MADIFRRIQRRRWSGSSSSSDSDDGKISEKPVPSLPKNTTLDNTTFKSGPKSMPVGRNMQLVGLSENSAIQNSELLHENKREYTSTSEVPECLREIDDGAIHNFLSESNHPSISQREVSNNEDVIVGN